MAHHIVSKSFGGQHVVEVRQFSGYVVPSHQVQERHQGSATLQEITQFKIAASHTLNQGNYESMRVEAEITVAVREGSDYEELKARAQPELRKLLEETYRSQRKGERKPV